MKTADIASVCHEANRALQTIQGEIVNFPWDNTNQAMRDSTMQGVVGIIAGNSPEESHECWLAVKAAEGWTYGETKDFAAKTHPCFLPYALLPDDQKIKDSLFSAIVKALS